MGLTVGTGTALYRAPEVEDGNGMHGLKADVFSLGITIAVCFGREFPVFNQQSGEIDFNLCRRMTGRGEMVMQDQAYGQYPATWQRCSVEMKHLVSQMCRVNPEQRCTMAQAMCHSFWGASRVGPEEMEAINAQGRETMQRMAQAPLLPDLF